MTSCFRSHCFSVYKIFSLAFGSCIQICHLSCCWPMWSFQICLAAVFAMRPLCGFEHSSQGQLWPVPALLIVSYGQHICTPFPIQAILICTGKAHSKFAWLLTSSLKCVSFFLAPLGKAIVVWCTKIQQLQKLKRRGVFHVLCMCVCQIIPSALEQNGK